MNKECKGFFKKELFYIYDFQPPNSKQKCFSATHESLLTMEIHHSGLKNKKREIQEEFLADFIMLRHF